MTSRTIRQRLTARFHAVLPALRDKLRATPLLLLGAITFGVVLLMNPAKVGLLIWGASRIGLYGYLGYWVDRVLFPGDARPHRLTGISLGTAWKRRALIVAASLIAGALLP